MTECRFGSGKINAYSVFRLDAFLPWLPLTKCVVRDIFENTHFLCLCFYIALSVFFNILISLIRSLYISTCL